MVERTETAILGIQVWWECQSCGNSTEIVEQVQGKKILAEPPRTCACGSNKFRLLISISASSKKENDFLRMEKA